MFNLLQTGNNENFQRKDCCYQSMTLKVEKLFASLNMFLSLYTLTMQKTVSKKKKKSEWHKWHKNWTILHCKASLAGTRKRIWFKTV